MRRSRFPEVVVLLGLIALLAYWARPAPPASARQAPKLNPYQGSHLAEGTEASIHGLVPGGSRAEMERKLGPPQRVVEESVNIALHYPELALYYPRYGAYDYESGKWDEGDRCTVIEGAQIQVGDHQLQAGTQRQSLRLALKSDYPSDNRPPYEVYFLGSGGITVAYQGDLAARFYLWRY